MLEYGLSVRNGQPYCGEIKLSLSALAKASGTDRRIVTATLETIETSDFLRQVFTKLEPTASYKLAAPNMNWGVLEIVPEDVQRPGIIFKVSEIIAKEGISIRQFIADDPDLSPNPKAFIITESQIPGKLLQKIKDIPGISSVTIY